MLTYTNEEARRHVKSLDLPDIPVYLWTLVREDVKAIFSKHAFALLQKIPQGWMVSYMYTIPESRRQGHMKHLLRQLTSNFTLFAVPTDAAAENCLQSCGFRTDTVFFGSPYYRSH